MKNTLSILIIILSIGVSYILGLWIAPNYQPVGRTLIGAASLVVIFIILTCIYLLYIRIYEFLEDNTNL